MAERLRGAHRSRKQLQHVATATVVELCRFYYDQPDLAGLTATQAAEMADRLRYAQGVGGVDDAKLARLAGRGLAMEDRAQAAQAADVWLTFRAADGGSEADPA